MKYKLLVKPEFFKSLGLIYNSAQVIYPYIVIPQSLKQKLEDSNPESISILEHEKFHLNRIKALGVCKWYFKYVFNPKFRLNEEILAYKKQFEVLRKYNIDFNVDKYSKILSSWTYLKMIDEGKAKELLKN